MSCTTMHAHMTAASVSYTLVARCTHMIRSHTYTRAPSVSAGMHRSHIDISTHYFTIRTSRVLAQL